jgi:hypothetical protein
MSKRSTTLAWVAALMVGLTVSLTGVAQAAPQRTYRITIHTANVTNAGTDGDVSLKIKGASGNATTYIPLDNSDDNWERDKIDRFDRLATDVGTPTGVCVHFNSGSGQYAAWFLDYVMVDGQFFQVNHLFPRAPDVVQTLSIGSPSPRCTF